MDKSHPYVSVRDWISENIKKFKTREDCVAACVKTMKRHPLRVKQVYGEVARGLTAEVMAKNADTLPKIAPKQIIPSPLRRDSIQTTSVAQFMAKYDYEARLRVAIRKLCKTQFVSDLDMRNEADIPAPVFRKVAAMEEFLPCQLKDNGKVWWSTPENVEKVRSTQRQWGLK